MKKIMNNLDARFLLSMAFGFAYTLLFGFVMKLLGLICIPIALICVISALFAVCYTMQAIDSYYESKEKGISFKEAWEKMRDDGEDCI